MPDHLDSPVEPFSPAQDPFPVTPPHLGGPAVEEASPPASRATTFEGRTPDRTPAIRAGALLGAALVVLVGSAVALGASPRATSGGAGAAASPASSDVSTSAPPSDPVRNGDGRDGQGFGPFGGFGFGPGGRGRDDGDRLAGPLGGLGRITVTKVDGSTVSLATDDGWTRTISVTSDTTITKGGDAATVGDLTPGDVVRLREKRNASGSWTVTAIAILRPRVAGTVTAVGADTITITGRDGASQTIRTTASTTYRRGDAAASRRDVTVGSIVAAVGDRATDGTLTASAVLVALPRVNGTVASVGSDSLVVTRRDGTTMTVHVDASTTFVIRGIASATLADISAGMRVAVEGTQRADGSLDAASIRAGLGDRPKGPGHEPGSSPEPPPSGSNG